MSNSQNNPARWVLFALFYRGENRLTESKKKTQPMGSVLASAAGTNDQGLGGLNKVLLLTVKAPGAGRALV